MRTLIETNFVDISIIFTLSVGDQPHTGDLHCSRGSRDMSGGGQ